MKKITIAIDGFSSTGKSTVAKRLAKHLGYAYVDSGAMYRAVTWFAMKQNIINNEKFDVDSLVSHLDDIHISFVFNKEVGFAEVYLNDENIEKHIRTLEVSNYVSKIAEISEVRSQLVKQQQKLGKGKGVIMDGRDIGTVVFPEAELKLFLTASAENRAKRRFEELVDKGHDVLYADVLKNVQERDYIDSHRKDSPLKKAEDAIEIDNSNMTKDEQFDIILELIHKKLNEKA